MQITKEILLADKQALSQQANGLAQTIQYIDQLIAFLDKAEAVKAPELVVESEAA